MAESIEALARPGEVSTTEERRTQRPVRPWPALPAGRVESPSQRVLRDLGDLCVDRRLRVLFSSVVNVLRGQPQAQIPADRQAQIGDRPAKAEPDIRTTSGRPCYGRALRPCA